jgi:hypothetical protein
MTSSTYAIEREVICQLARSELFRVGRGYVVQARFFLEQRAGPWLQVSPCLFTRTAPPSRFCDHRPSSLLSLATYATHPMVDERRNEFPSSDKRALALGIDKKRRVIERHCHITTAPSQLFFSISCESWLHYIHDFLLTNCIIGQTKKYPQ